MPEQSAAAASPALDHVENWVFDLDNTLYRVTAEMSADINRLMRGFVMDLLAIDEDEAHQVQKSYFREYGLTVRGLMLNHGLDPSLYMEHMSQIDLSHIGPDPRMAQAIERLDGRKIIYTNAFGKHTETVLDRMGIADLFDEIHDIETADYLPKPDIGAYRDLCQRYNIDPRRAIMVEDTPHNLVPAAELGMTTLWIRTSADWVSGGDGADYIHHVTEDLAHWLETHAVPDG